MGKTSNTVRSGGRKQKVSGVYLPGTSLPAPVLKPIYFYEAMHLSGYRVEGMPLGTYIYEALKVMRDCLLPKKVNIIPLRYDSVYNVYETWNYAKNAIGTSIKKIDLEKGEVTIATNTYDSKTITLKRNG